MWSPRKEGGLEEERCVMEFEKEGKGDDGRPPYIMFWQKLRASLEEGANKALHQGE